MNSEISDRQFRQAVEAIDTGNIALLHNLLLSNPKLVSKRLDSPTEGYFKHPYLLWFVAQNPIRNETVPSNIVDITKLVVQFIRQNAPDSFQEQIDYTLGLVATGRVPRESGVQIEWIDYLVDEGANPGNGLGALAHGNKVAAAKLIERGGKLTLTTAIGLDRRNDISQLLKKATTTDKQIALVASAFWGKSEMIRTLLDAGADANVYIDSSSGFHSHASALHQAVYSGSLDSVKVLVEAGANLAAVDSVYEGTPLGWARYMGKEEKDKNKRENFAVIEKYLQERAENPNR